MAKLHVVSVDVIPYEILVRMCFWDSVFSKHLLGQ